MINISYLPNIEKDDFLLTLKMILELWRWKKREGEILLKKEIEKILGEKVFLLTSGRGCLWMILKELGIGKGDEVIIQAFTCVAVVNPILAVGAKPVYGDIDNTYNFNIHDLKKKITEKTKAIIIQDTFGIPAERGKILKLAKENNIFVIEDLAHSFGGEFKGKKLGTFGDAAFGSFGRTKVLSSMFGGAGIVKGRRRMREGLTHPSYFWVFRQLFHQIIFYIFAPFYDCLGIGKFLLFLMAKIGILSKEVENGEKNGVMVKNHIKRMPNALCILATAQLKKLNKFLEKREKISAYYQGNLKKSFYKFPKEKLPYLRFPVEVMEKEELVKFAKKRGIYLGDWYSQSVAPAGVNLEMMGYKTGNCSMAEKKNKLIINLPTNPTLNMIQVNKVVEVLNEFAGKKG